MNFEQWYESHAINYEFDRPKQALEFAFDYQQQRIDALKTAVREILEYIGDDFDDCYTGVMVKSIHEDFNLSELLK